MHGVRRKSLPAVTMGKFNLPISEKNKKRKNNGINAQKCAKNAKNAVYIGKLNLPHKNTPFVKMKNDDFF